MLWNWSAAPPSYAPREGVSSVDAFVYINRAPPMPKVQESSKDQLTVPQHCFKPVHANLHNTRDLYTNVGHPAGSSCAPQCLHNVGQWTQCWTLRGTMLTQPDLSLPGQSRAFTVSAITIKVPGAIVLTFYPADCWTNIKCDGWRNARKWTKNYDRSWTKF